MHAFAGFGGDTCIIPRESRHQIDGLLSFKAWKLITDVAEHLVEAALFLLLLLESMA